MTSPILPRTTRADNPGPVAAWTHTVGGLLCLYLAWAAFRMWRYIDVAATQIWVADHLSRLPEGLITREDALAIAFVPSALEIVVFLIPEVRNRYLWVLYPLMGLDFLTDWFAMSPAFIPPETVPFGWDYLTGVLMSLVATAWVSLGAQTAMLTFGFFAMSSLSYWRPAIGFFFGQVGSLIPPRTPPEAGAVPGPRRTILGLGIVPTALVFAVLFISAAAFLLSWGSPELSPVGGLNPTGAGAVSGGPE